MKYFWGFQAKAGLTKSKTKTKTKKNGVLLSSVEVLCKGPTKGGLGRQERLNTRVIREVISGAYTYL